MVLLDHRWPLWLHKEQKGSSWRKNKKEGEGIRILGVFSRVKVPSSGFPNGWNDLPELSFFSSDVLCKSSGCDVMSTMNDDDLATFYKEMALDDDEADINIDVVDQSLLDEGVMKLQGSFTVKARGMNMFVFHFDLITDRKRVLEGGPWVFKHCLLELKEPDDVLAPTEMVFDYALFWIHIHKVLVCCMTKSWGFELGKSTGEVLDVLCGPNGLCTGVFMKVRVSVDVHKPLVRVIRRPIGGWSAVGGAELKSVVNDGLGKGKGIMVEDSVNWHPVSDAFIAQDLNSLPVLDNSFSKTIVDGLDLDHGFVGDGSASCFGSTNNENKVTSVVMVDKGANDNLDVATMHGGTSISSHARKKIKKKVSFSNKYGVLKMKSKSPKKVFKHGLKDENCLANVDSSGLHEVQVDIVKDASDVPATEHYEFFGLERSRSWESPTFQILSSHVKEFSPGIIFLSKTLVTHSVLEVMRVRLGFIGKLVVEKVSRSGRLCLFWSINVNVVLKGYARSHIDVMVCSHGDLWWRYTGFYGQPEAHLRSQFWCLLERLADGYSGPWFWGGDFNEILFSYKKSGGSVRAQSLMDGFHNALAKCGLVDMGYEGARFTWCNKHTSGSFLLLLTRILRACESRKRPKQKGRFHFEMAWENDSGCWEIIAKHWGPSETREAIRKKKKELEVLDSNLNDSNWLSYKKMESELDVLLYKDEKYWFSRAKIVFGLSRPVASL
ncbi:hypothetical protein F8388_025032 [Cannabis sativa]|uniref:DUF4283 domain-containing protein n=1 Tax=Cannabis sativa TaxID=3483 RepID=A0A7J6G3J1_CANSA|nr:hypothetical protein F8388_025032 [Cannabis sativa]